MPAARRNSEVSTAVVLTELGEFCVSVAGNAVVEVGLPDAGRRPHANAEDNELLEQAAVAIADGVAGRPLPSLPMHLEGTDFQLAVWRALMEIPAGEVITYGDLASRAGYPGAARAVGSAMRANPLPILIPCHRVVAADGIGGYAGGLELKRALLAAEGVEVGEHGLGGPTT